MMAEILAPTSMAALVVAPLAWSLWRDRREARALAIRAGIQWIVDRHLSGESLVAVTVTPPTMWRPGRVLLSAPADWEWLLDDLWSPVVRAVPARYELVVPGRERGANTVPTPAVAKRAA